MMITNQMLHQLIVAAVFSALGLIILGLAYRVYVKAGKIAGYGDTTDVLFIPVGPFVYFMALMVAVTAVVHIVKAFIPAPDKPKTFDPDQVSPT